MFPSSRFKKGMCTSFRVSTRNSPITNQGIPTNTDPTILTLNGGIDSFSNEVQSSDLTEASDKEVRSCSEELRDSTNDNILQENSIIEDDITIENNNNDLVDNEEDIELNEDEFAEIGTSPLEQFVDHYLDQIQTRLRGGKIPEEYKNGTFWIHRKEASFTLVDNNAPPLPRVFLWAPHHLQKDLKCPTCNHKIQVKSFNKKPRARRIIDIDDSFFLMTMRYRCRNPSSSHTFNGYDSCFMDQLRQELRNGFPAILTHRAGISKSVANLKRSCFKLGIGQHRMSKILKLMHTENNENNELKSYLECLDDNKTLEVNDSINKSDLRVTSTTPSTTSISSREASSSIDLNSRNNHDEFATVSIEESGLNANSLQKNARSLCLDSSTQTEASSNIPSQSTDSTACHNKTPLRPLAPQSQVHSEQLFLPPARIMPISSKNYPPYNQNISQPVLIINAPPPVVFRNYYRNIRPNAIGYHRPLLPLLPASYPPGNNINSKRPIIVAKVNISPKRTKRTCMICTQTRCPGASFRAHCVNKCGICQNKDCSGKYKISPCKNKQPQ